MGKKFWMSFVVVFIIFAILQFLAHAVLLSKVYMAPESAQLWKPEEAQKQMFLLHLLSELVFAYFFCLIYVKGFESGKGFVAQGFRYSLYAGLLVYLPVTLTHMAVLNAPNSMLAMQFIYNLITVILTGLVLGAMYKPAPKSVM